MPRDHSRPKSGPPAKPDTPGVSAPNISLLDFVRTCLNLTPDPEQTKLLKLDPRRCILNCTRQWGKSTITAAKAVHKACTEPGSLTVVLSPSARQSAEFVLKARTFLQSLGISTKSDGHNEISIALDNKSRIVGLPSSEDKIRGFSAVSLLLIDEAARVDDSLYTAVRPMLATSNGQFWLLSTPNGRAGFFYREWIANSSQWTRFEIPATKCPRISPLFLDEERLSHTRDAFLREYCCQFLDPEGAVFPYSLLQDTLCDVEALPIHRANANAGVVVPPTDRHLRTEFEAMALARGVVPPGPPVYYIGVDIGQSQDYTAISIVERADIISGPQDRITYSWPKTTLRTVRFLHRIPLGTSYPDVAELVAGLTKHPSIANRSNKLIVDGTGVGKPVIDIIRSHHVDPILHTVIITAGDATKRELREGDTHWLARNALLALLETGLQNRTLQISRHVPLAGALLEELNNLYRDPNNPAGEALRPQRQSIHDDLVFATALAFWRASWKF
ncbi:MAG: terminase family protein [Bryobacterales bacterium]|nr:terminase family protein [Bryobacterales bacterium]